MRKLILALVALAIIYLFITNIGLIFSIAVGIAAFMLVWSAMSWVLYWLGCKAFIPRY